MAGWKSAGLCVTRRPGGDHHSPACRVGFQLVDEPGDLVIAAIVRQGKMAPEVAISARHLVIFVRPRIPEFAVVPSKQVNIRIARQEPEVFNNDILPGYFLGCEQGKALAQVDFIIDIECGDRVYPRPVGLSLAGFQGFPYSVEILLQFLFSGVVR